MPYALIKGGAITAVYDTIPGIVGGFLVAAATPGIVLPDGAQFVDASFSDEEPANSVRTGFDLASSTVNAGPPVTASIKRTWQTVPPPNVTQCTKAQALRALVAAGVADPLSAIQTGISAISDTPTRVAAQIAFAADQWDLTNSFWTQVLTALNFTAADQQQAVTNSISNY